MLRNGWNGEMEPSSVRIPQPLESHVYIMEQYFDHKPLQMCVSVSLIFRAAQ
jgi:hypothetical protein